MFVKCTDLNGNKVLINVEKIVYAIADGEGSFLKMTDDVQLSIREQTNHLLIVKHSSPFSNPKK